MNISSKIWQFLALIASALLMGTTFAHILELPVKMTLDGQLWLTLQQTLYRYFAIVGGVVEISAIILVALTTWRVRGQPAFLLSLIATILLAVAFFVVWLLFTNPVNTQTTQWTATSIPADWERWRSQWEYSHLVRFILHLIAFGALTVAALFRSA